MTTLQTLLDVSGIADHMMTFVESAADKRNLAATNQGALTAIEDHSQRQLARMASKHGADPQWLGRIIGKARLPHNIIPQRVLEHFAKDVPVKLQNIPGRHRPLAAVRIGSNNGLNLVATIDGGTNGEDCIRIWKTSAGRLQCVAHQMIEENFQDLDNQSQLHYLEGCNRIVFNPNQWDGRSGRTQQELQEKIFAWDLDGAVLSQRQTLILPEARTIAIAPDDGMLYCTRFSFSTQEYQLQAFSFDGDAPAAAPPGSLYLNGQHCAMAVCGQNVLVLVAGLGGGGLYVFRRENLELVHQYIPKEHMGTLDLQPELCIEGDTVIAWGKFWGVEGLYRMAFNQDMGRIDQANSWCLIKQSDFTITDEAIFMYGIYCGQVYALFREENAIRVFDAHTGEMIQSISLRRLGRTITQWVLLVEDELFFYQTKYRYSSNSRNAILHRYIL